MLLDIEDANILREEAQVEESIRITSSLAARMVKNKMNLWVKSNAKDEETGEELPAMPLWAMQKMAKIVYFR